MSRRAAALGALSVLLVVAVVALARHRAAQRDMLHPVTAMAPLERPVEESHADPGLLGVVLARESVDLVPKIEGRLESIDARLGDKVKKDQVLASLDLRPVKRDLAMGEAELKAAVADVDKAELDLSEAKERLERRRAPLKAGIQAVSGDELATAEYRFRQAKPNLAAARARAAEKQARVEQLRQTVEDALIRAPFDGEVAARFVDPGALVGPHTTIVRLISGNDLWVRFAAPEERAAGLRVGQTVRVRVTGVDGELPGAVEKVAPEIDASSRMVFAEARLTGAAGKQSILAGRVARVFTDVVAQNK